MTCYPTYTKYLRLPIVNYGINYIHDFIEKLLTTKISEQTLSPFFLMWRDSLGWLLDIWRFGITNRIINLHMFSRSLVVLITKTDDVYTIRKPYWSSPSTTPTFSTDWDSIKKNPVDHLGISTYCRPSRDTRHRDWIASRKYLQQVP